MLTMAIIGAAQIVEQYHAFAIRALPQVTVNVVVDLDLGAAKRVAKILSCDASTDLMSVAGVDIIFIAAPPAARTKIFESMPPPGSHVVLEKPVSIDLSGYHTIEAWSQRHGKGVVVAQTRRFFPNLVGLSALVSAGTCGVIRKISLCEGGILSWVSNSDHLAKSIDPQDKGVLQDVGAHTLDVINNLLQGVGASLESSKLTSVASDQKILCNDVEIELTGSVDVHMHLSRSSGLANLIKIEGDSGELQTRSLLDNTIRLRTSLNKIEFIRTRYDLDEYSLETAFIEMWKCLLINPSTSNLLSLETVRPVVTMSALISDAIDQ